MIIAIWLLCSVCFMGGYFLGHGLGVKKGWCDGWDGAIECVKSMKESVNEKTNGTTDRCGCCR